MGSSASKTLKEADMAQEASIETAKPKLDDDELNWSASDLEHALEKRRKLEDAEPYNDEAVRQKAKEIGIEKAMSSSVSEASKMQVMRSQNVPPRGLSSEGDESSEFVSADDDDGVPVEAADGEVAIEGEFLNRTASERKSGQGSEEGSGSDEEEEGDGSSESQHEAEETQVVQDSVAAGAGISLDADLDGDRDSGHGSMDDSEVEAEENEQASDSTPESARQAPLANGSQDRISAAEETVRQIKAERNGGAAIEGSSAEESGVGEGLQRQIPVPGPDDGEAREKYVADRKARKKEPKALYRSSQRTLINQRRHTHLLRDIAPKKKPATPILRMRDGKPKGPSKSKHTQAQKRILKRARRQAEMERAARENPGHFAQKLQAQIVDVSDVSDFSDSDEKREHRIAAKKSRRAAFMLQKFQELVGRVEAGEGGSDVEM